jgi:hypothetical protein
MADTQKQTLFGIRSLIILTTLAAMGIVGVDFFINQSKNSGTITLFLFAASTVIGLTAIGYSLLFAIYTATSRKPPQLKTRQFRTSYQMFLFGLFALLPAFAIVVIGLTR